MVLKSVIKSIVDVNFYILIRRCMLLIIIVCGYTVTGQMDRANRYFDKKYYPDAIEDYLKVLEKGSYDDEEVFRKLADSYYAIANYGEAATWYSKLLISNPLNTEDYAFQYAQTLKVIGAYPKADEMLQKYFSEQGEDYIPASDYLSNLDKATSVVYNVKKCKGCNSKYSEFPAYLNGDTLYLSGPNKGGFYLNAWNKQPTYDIYKIVGENKKNVFAINSDANEGSLTISKNGEVMYFTSNNDESNLKIGKNAATINIYRAQRRGNGWGKVEKLPINFPGYSMMHPSLSNDGTTLYFASDIVGYGGKGGMDIYKVEIIDDNKFGEIQNVSELNTIGDETFPFITDQGVMYFSSNGHENIGGKDVFSSVLNADGTFSQPRNLGRQINSSWDDFAFVINNEGRGYFASNRNGGVNDEVYSFNSSPFKMDSIRNRDPLITDVSGNVLDKELEISLRYAEVELLDQNKTVLYATTTDAYGGYDFQGVDVAKVDFVRLKRKGYETMDIRFFPNAEGKVETFDFWLERMNTDDVLEALKGFVNRVIYFGFDSYELNDRAKKGLYDVSVLMKEFKDIRIILSGHTDNIGSEDYNIQLSRNRTNIVSAYLQRLGIESGRIISAPYGDSKPLNANCNGDCPENRAVEITRVEKNELLLDFIKG